MDWGKLFQAIMGAEQVFLPIFVHNPKSQTIAAAIVVSEGIFAQIFGIVPAVVAPTQSATAPAAVKPSGAGPTLMSQGPGL